MKQEYLDKVIARSKIRKDGVYTFGCIDYSVKNKIPVFISDGFNIWQYSHGFLVSLGKVERYKGLETIKKLHKS